MEDKLELKNVKKRIEHIEEVLSSVASGDLDIRIESEIEDDLTGIEEAINILIEDLTYELKQSINMQNELQEKLKKIQEQQKPLFSNKRI